MKILVNDFESFKELVKSVSKKLNESGVFNICEARNYEEYDWFVAYFGVDKFGGTAFSVGNIGGKWFSENFANHGERVFKDNLKDCFEGIVDALKKEYEVRDLEGLSDFINSQNED